MIKNIKQTIQLSASALLTSGLMTPEIILECDKVLAGEHSLRLKEMLNSNEALRGGLDELGAEFPFSKIDVTLTLGLFLFSLFVSHIPRPKTTTKSESYSNKIDAYASRFNIPEFSITKAEITKLERILNTDALWAKSSLMVSAGVAGHKLAVTPDSVALFKEIVGAAIEVFSAPKKTKGKVK